MRKEKLVLQCKGLAFQLQRWRRILVHHGSAVECPVCGSHFDAFGAGGCPCRSNAWCWRCGAAERHRLLWKYIAAKTDLFEPSPKRLLHFAPERGFYKAFCRMKHIAYVPCELHPENYRPFVRNHPILKADVMNIAFGDETFDVVLCNHVLEHIPDDRLALRELYRVMKKGAWAILQVPVDYQRKTTYEDVAMDTPAKRAQAFGQSDHVRRYGRDYADVLRSVGFDVTEDDFVTTLATEDVRRWALDISEIIYLCRKK